MTPPGFWFSKIHLNDKTQNPLIGFFMSVFFMISDSVPTTYVRAEKSRSEYMRPYMKKHIQKKTWNKKVYLTDSLKMILMICTFKKSGGNPNDFFILDLYFFRFWIPEVQRIFISPLWGFGPNPIREKWKSVVFWKPKSRDFFLEILVKNRKYIP